MTTKKSSSKRTVIASSLFLSLVAGAALSHGAGSTEPKEAPPASPAPAAAKPDGAPIAAFDSFGDEAQMSEQDRQMFAWAKEFSAECGQVLERWIASRAITEEKLFARLYYPVPNTDPVKYKTEYDALSDKDIAPIEERFLSKADALSYVVLSDLNGYVPSHNQKYSQPLTGNRAVDLVNNRTKRIFMTLVGFRSARSEAPFLVQVNERDNGERALNLSVPVWVKGKHWGAVRFGYRPIRK